MATGAQATERVAKATGVSVTYVERAARILKEADADLWPKARKGGGKGAVHVMPSHLVNLLLALMAADPITEAPEIVPRCRALIPALNNDLASNEFEPGLDPHIVTILNDFCPGSNLGERFEGLVRTLMQTDNRARVCQLLGKFEVGRSFQSGGTICATTEISNAIVGFVTPIGDVLDLPEDWERPEAAIQNTKSVPFRIFETLADLALDTECALGRAGAPEGAEDTPNVAGDTVAEDVNTTTPATGGTGPAPVETASQPGCNPVNPAERDSQQDRGTRERGQSPSPAAPPGSPSSGPTDQTEEGHHGQTENFRHAAQPEHRVRR